MPWPWSKREPRPDPVGDICRLLVERPWEWEQTRSYRDGSLRHRSGVEVVWDGGVWERAWLRMNGQELRIGEARDVRRIIQAVARQLAERVKRPVAPFTDSAVALAKAVLAGDHEAARLLADEVFEHARGSP